METCKRYKDGICSITGEKVTIGHCRNCVSYEEEEDAK